MNSLMKMSPPPTISLAFKLTKFRLKETKYNSNFIDLRVLIDQLDPMEIYLEGQFL